jgi:hypothetical protein
MDLVESAKSRLHLSAGTEQLKSHLDVTWSRGRINFDNFGNLNTFQVSWIYQPDKSELVHVLHHYFAEKTLVPLCTTQIWTGQSRRS